MDIVFTSGKEKREKGKGTGFTQVEWTSPFSPRGPITENFERGYDFFSMS
jgi:hypothetical protein